MAILVTSEAQRHQLADVVLSIELEMRRAALWHETAPRPAAMASRMPFCADTLEFGQWLQFVFIPRMHRVIEGHDPLPQSSAIAPMAEETLARCEARTDGLLRLLREFDALIGD